MALSLRVLMILVSLTFLAFVILQVRKGKYLLKYSLLWLVLGIAGLIAAMFPKLIYAISGFLGFEAPSNFLYFAIVLFLVAFCLSLCGVVSRQTLQIKRLIQQVSLLDADAKNTNEKR